MENLMSWWPSNVPRGTVAAVVVMTSGAVVVARAGVKEVAAPSLTLLHDPPSLSLLRRSPSLSPKPAQTLMLNLRLRSLKPQTPNNLQPMRPRPASPEPDRWGGHAFFLASSQPVPSI
jgi:hypothetical protein